MNDLHEFFSASVGASAAFIGLLFVAVALAPERVFGLEAHPKRRADAARAFVALANIFFVSLAALIPQDGLSIMLVISILSIAQIIREARSAARIHPMRDVVLSYGTASLGIYIAQFVLILRLNLGYASLDGLLYVIIGLYMFALITSWQLLSLRDNPRTD